MIHHKCVVEYRSETNKSNLRIHMLKKYQTLFNLLDFWKKIVQVQMASIRHSFLWQSECLGMGLMKHVINTNPRVGHHGNTCCVHD